LRHHRVGHLFQNRYHKGNVSGSAVPWQDADEVLTRFGQSAKAARIAYEKFVAEGIPLGKVLI
jgi:hypothetical protein